MIIPANFKHYLNCLFEMVITQHFLKTFDIFNWYMFILKKLSYILFISLTLKEPIVLSMLVVVITFFVEFFVCDHSQILPNESH